MSATSCPSYGRFGLFQSFLLFFHPRATTMAVSVVFRWEYRRDCHGCGSRMQKEQKRLKKAKTTGGRTRGGTHWAMQSRSKFPADSESGVKQAPPLVLLTVVLAFLSLFCSFCILEPQPCQSRRHSEGSTTPTVANEGSMESPGPPPLRTEGQSRSLGRCGLRNGQLVSSIG